MTVAYFLALESAVADGHYLWDDYAVTPEFWTIGGVCVHTNAVSLDTLDGRDNLVPLRGENTPIGNRPGTVPSIKQWDERTITLSMWIQGCMPDGSIPDDPVEQFRLNLELVKLVLGTKDQIELTRRLVVPEQFYGAMIQKRTAMGQVSGSVDVKMDSPASCQLVVDLVMADPFWYTAEQLGTTPLPRESSGFTFPLVFPMRFGGIGGSGVLHVLVNGTAPLARNTLEFVGPITNPSVEHVASAASMTFNVTLGAADRLIVNEADRSIMLNGVYRPDLLSFDSDWIVLEQGDNVLRFRADVGTGHLEVRWQDVWH